MLPVQVEFESTYKVIHWFSSLCFFKSNLCRYTKVMVERKLLERMLDLDLMSPMLDRPELTKEMFRSGVVKGVMNNGVLEALLAAGKEDVVVSLLRGPMLEVMMDTVGPLYNLNPVDHP
jgi:hypothetical protein